MSEVWAARRGDLDDGIRVAVDVDGTEVVVLADRGTLRAYVNRCPHQGGPVAEGIILGKVMVTHDPAGGPAREAFSTAVRHLICPWHGWEFDVETGVSATHPDRCLRQYPVLVRGTDVYVVGGQDGMGSS